MLRTYIYLFCTISVSSLLGMTPDLKLYWDAGYQGGLVGGKIAAEQFLKSQASSPVSVKGVIGTVGGFVVDGVKGGIKEVLEFKDIRSLIVAGMVAAYFYNRWSYGAEMRGLYTAIQRAETRATAAEEQAKLAAGASQRAEQAAIRSENEATGARLGTEKLMQDTASLIEQGGAMTIRLATVEKNQLAFGTQLEQHRKEVQQGFEDGKKKQAQTLQAIDGVGQSVADLSNKNQAGTALLQSKLEEVKTQLQQSTQSHADSQQKTQQMLESYCAQHDKQMTVLTQQQTEYQINMNEQNQNLRTLIMNHANQNNKRFDKVEAAQEKGFSELKADIKEGNARQEVHNQALGRMIVESTKEVNSRLGKIESGMFTLEEEVGGIKKDISTIKQNVGTIDKKISTICHHVSLLSKGAVTITFNAPSSALTATTGGSLLMPFSSKVNSSVYDLDEDDNNTVNNTIISTFNGVPDLDEWNSSSSM